MKIKYITFITALIAFTGCNDPEDVLPDGEMEVLVETPALTSGSADFSTYVSLGNSLTSGFTDNALFKAGQENSFPNILAAKFAIAGGGSFSQPLTNDNFGGLLAGGAQISGFNPRLVFGGAGPVALSSIIGPVTPTTDIVLNNPVGPFNNMGVPGAKSFHLLASGYGNLGNLSLGLANPYFIRMTGSTPDASILELAMAQSPTFFSLWIGNNDAMGYALSGGDGSNPITDQPTFDFAISTLVSTLTSGGAKGVMANVPYVTTLPHFTTVPYNPLDPSNPAFGPQIATLNATFAPLNQAFAFLGMSERSIVFATDEASPVIIYDESLPNISVQLSQVLQGGGLDAITAGLLANQFGQSRQATPEDLFVLPSSSVIATVNVPYYTQLVTAGVPMEFAGQLSVNGVTYPLEDKWVLIPSEQDEIKMAIDSFNATIASAASGAGLAFVDANALMQKLADSGFEDGDFTLSANLVTGGAFSLDGVHPTARGYALIANEFMKAIDVTYGSNFKDSGSLINIGDYPTNYSPALQ